MLMTDLIAKKRDGHDLSTDEINYMIRAYTRGEIEDYQMSAMCMAILFRGMYDRETLDLTMAMMHSGDLIDLSAIEGVKADKHSTGGVGDKTSLILCPMVAACGVKIAKMSGRGLGHTGGTLDKLESFPGFNISIGEERFIDNVRRIGISLIGQTADIVPADKKLYALRDVTGTVPSIPLIVSSIMSKKLASGADVIVLDVKCGSGAFMKTEHQARELAQGLTRIGKLAGKKCAAVITDMDQPLGHAVGNALEVKEAISVLKGETKGDLLELCLSLGGLILTESGIVPNDERAREMLQETITSGAALKKLAEMVEAQDGEARDVYDTSRLPLAPVRIEVPSRTAGYLSHIECDEVGMISMHLGGGRETKDSEIDLSVGLILHKKVGDHMEIGESLGTIHARDEKTAEEAAALLRACCTFSDEPVERPAFIKAVIR
ncbi:MAG: pyrimidine-nucleoside phosphorylase [Oscillospiraceae bacterium]|nr:pyrimidine-nucleoside phosphorylase [Oscillospiraceae bacterium]